MALWREFPVKQSIVVGTGCPLGSDSFPPSSSTDRPVKRKRGRPKNSWRRDTEEEMRSISTSWQDLRKNTPMKLLPLRPRRSASPPPRSASPPQKICFAPVVPLRPRRNSALPSSFCLAPNGGTAHSRHENRLQNNNKGCAAKFKVAHAPANILDTFLPSGVAQILPIQKFTPTSRPVSLAMKSLGTYEADAGVAVCCDDDFRVDCELCRHWGLSRRTRAKQNCAGGVEERRGRSRFFAGAKQNGTGAKQNGGGEEEGVSWGCTGTRQVPGRFSDDVLY
ncbi:hypothetical protein Bbelb_309730 [Branchiostoma belcheri]|nr:hypothetical protein Bbelb_309730 [Branchiostoma belcheri]